MELFFIMSENIIIIQIKTPKYQNVSFVNGTNLNKFAQQEENESHFSLPNWCFLQMLPTGWSIHSALATRLFRSTKEQPPRRWKFKQPSVAGNPCRSSAWILTGCERAVGELRTFGCTLLPDHAETKRQQIWSTCELRSDQRLPDWPPLHSTWGRSGWSVRGTQTQISTAEALRLGGWRLSTFINQRWTFWHKGPPSWLWPASETGEHLWSWLETRTACSAAAKR